MRALLTVIFIVALAYAGLTAYAGFRVARGIDHAKAHSVFTRVAIRMMGRDAAEKVALREGHIPKWITQSPAFWWTLRAYE